MQITAISVCCKRFTTVGMFAASLCGMTSFAQKAKTSAPVSRPAPAVARPVVPAHPTTPTRPTNTTLPGRPSTTTAPTRPNTPFPNRPNNVPVNRPLETRPIDPVNRPMETRGPGSYNRTDGGRTVIRQGGERAEFNRAGRIQEFHRPPMLDRPGFDGHFNSNASGRPDAFRMQRGDELHAVRRGPGGVRVYEGAHPALGGGQVRVVGYGPHAGFMEKPVFGRPGYMRRTYMVGDRRYAVMYRGYHYHGVAFYRPVPSVIYAPGYYGWAVRPWGPGVPIAVGFTSAPWYGAYGPAFTPYPVYNSPDQWMTDQMLASNMQQAYDNGRDAQAQQDAAAQGGDYSSVVPPEITAQLKDQIDTQVKTEIQEQARLAAAGPTGVVPPTATAGELDELPDALKPGHTVFRVVDPLTLSANGRPCTLNIDDWVVRNGDMDTNDLTVEVSVAASRATDCAQGSTTRIPLNDLMAMQNEFDQQVASVLQMASNSMGTKGMPAGPPAGRVPVPGGMANPDDVASGLQQEQVASTAAEQQVASAAVSGGQ